MLLKYTVLVPVSEKAMTTHSSVLAWRIPGTAEPGGLPSMGSHRVGHDWSDLAAAAAVPYCIMRSDSVWHEQLPVITVIPHLTSLIHFQKLQESEKKSDSSWFLVLLFIFMISSKTIIPLFIITLFPECSGTEVKYLSTKETK